jgi:hypothetical protein
MQAIKSFSSAAVVIIINRIFMFINDKIITRQLQGETVLLNMENGDYFTLNQMGTEIFSCISEGMDTEGIIEHLLEIYDAEYDRVKNDVISLIDKMKEKNIIIGN